MFSSTVETKQQSHGVGGLCHLVEAATALSKLVESPPLDLPNEKELVSAPSVAPVSPEKAVISDDDDDSCKKDGSKNKREIFPQRLMAILNDASLNEIVTWLPNGRSFVIVRPDVFTDTVLPKYLPPLDARGSTKYPSFTRKLNRWGFRQITRGPDTGAFHHPLFRRDEPELCLQMVCQRSRDRRSNSNSSSNTANKSVGARSLPPKKRAVVDANGFVPQVLQTRPPLAPTLATACVSSDDNSSSSSAGSSVRASTSSSVSRVILMNVALPPSTVCTSQTVTVIPKPPAAGYVSKDEAVIQNAIRQSVENERIRTAKAMLYHSYMQALGASSR